MLRKMLNINFCKILKIIAGKVRSQDMIMGFVCAKICRSRHELSNEYFIAATGIDATEKRPFKVCGRNQVSP